MPRQINWDSPSTEDIDWMVQWDRWREMSEAGWDVEQIARDRNTEVPGGVNIYNTQGVPRTGTDGMAETSGQTDPGNTGDNPSDPDDDLPDDYNQWTVAQLRDELKGRQLPADGNKSDLVARLEEDDASSEE